jgi:hypothetical protein
MDNIFMTKNQNYLYGTAEPCRTHLPPQKKMRKIIYNDEAKPWSRSISFGNQGMTVIKLLWNPGEPELR